MRAIKTRPSDRVYSSLYPSYDLIGGSTGVSRIGIRAYRSVQITQRESVLIRNNEKCCEGYSSLAPRNLCFTVLG